MAFPSLACGSPALTRSSNIASLVYSLRVEQGVCPLSWHVVGGLAWSDLKGHCEHKEPPF